METIVDYLKRNLREAGPARWAAIARETGCSVHLLRKLAYGDRDNPSVNTIQPLLDLFNAVDRGERKLPEPLPEAPASEAAA
jgi:transcriptional regulator with XRE-family HTH domain